MKARLSLVRRSSVASNDASGALTRMPSASCGLSPVPQPASAINVITVAREYGAGGGVIARRAAEQLGWKLLDQALIGDIAGAAQVDTETVAGYDERVDSWWRRFHHRGLWSAAIAGGVAAADAKVYDAETIASFAREAIAAAAEKGNCVIVGRGAQCALQDHRHAFHVFIYGPWRQRISRVRSRFDSGDAGEAIRSTDEERARYIRTYYGCDWKDPHLYHMMISSEIGINLAASAIIDAVRRSEQSSYAAHRMELHV